MRKQYNFWPGERGLDAWDVDRLVELSRDLAVTAIPLSSLTEIDSNCWSLDETTSVREVAEHVRLVNEADTRYPIILAASGRVMDGMHRVAKALARGDESILAVRFAVDPAPDYRDCHPDELPYEG